METRVKTNSREEILIDDVPIGNVLLNENGRVEWAEIYDDFIHTKFEARLMKGFSDKINEYEWADDD